MFFFLFSPHVIYVRSKLHFENVVKFLISYSDRHGHGCGKINKLVELSKFLLYITVLSQFSYIIAIQIVLNKRNVKVFSFFFFLFSVCYLGCVCGGVGCVCGVLVFLCQP